MKKVLLQFLFWVLRKEKRDMAVIYATLIVKGVLEFTDVPEIKQEEVKAILIALDCAELLPMESM